MLLVIRGQAPIISSASSLVIYIYVILYIGALMVLTLKVISCSINYSDGLLKEVGLSKAQMKNRLFHCPSVIKYFGYCLCCGSHFAGPVYEMKDYLDWTEQKGVGTRCNFLIYMVLFSLCFC